MYNVVALCDRKLQVPSIHSVHCSGVLEVRDSEKIKKAEFLWFNLVLVQVRVLSRNYTDARSLHITLLSPSNFYPQAIFNAGRGRVRIRTKEQGR